MEAKQRNDGSPSPCLQARGTESAEYNSEQRLIKVTCPNCTVWHARGKSCYHGNIPGDEYCQRDYRPAPGALEFVGHDEEGRYYFRDPAQSNRTFSGDMSDYNRWLKDRKCSDIIDAEEANRALRTVAQLRGHAA